MQVLNLPEEPRFSQELQVGHNMRCALSHSSVFSTVFQTGVQAMLHRSVAFSGVQTRSRKARFTVETEGRNGRGAPISLA